MLEPVREVASFTPVRPHFRQSTLVEEMRHVAASLNAAPAPEPGFITASLLVAGTEYNLEYPVRQYRSPSFVCCTCTVLALSKHSRPDTLGRSECRKPVCCARPTLPCI